MEQYLAALFCYHCIQINNLEHNDVTLNTGSNVVNFSGSLILQDGLLVQALWNGDWLIFDELNLAPRICCFLCFCHGITDFI
jgi:midasin